MKNHNFFSFYKSPNHLAATNRFGLVEMVRVEGAVVEKSCYFLFMCV